MEHRLFLEMELENLLAGVDRSVSADEPEPAAGACPTAMAVIELTGPFLAGA